MDVPLEHLELGDARNCNPQPPGDGALVVKRDLDCAYYDRCLKIAGRGGVLPEVKVKEPDRLVGWQSFTCEACAFHDVDGSKTVPFRSKASDVGRGTSIDGRSPIEHLMHAISVLTPSERFVLLERLRERRR